MLIISGYEIKDENDVFQMLADIADKDPETFISSDEWSYSWLPPRDWEDFHDFFLYQFEDDDEEYEKYSAFIDEMKRRGVPFEEIEEPEDPNQAGWDAWRSSRGI